MKFNRIVFIFLGGLVTTFGCNEPKSINSPQLDLVPESFLMPKAPFQPNCEMLCAEDPQTEAVNCATCRIQRTVRATNTGNETLIISDVSLDADNSQGEFLLRYQIPNGIDPSVQVGISENDEDRFSYPIQLEPGDEMLLDLYYTPRQEDTPMATALFLQTNLDAAGGRVRIPVIIADGTPRISVYPPRLNFQQVDAGNSVTRDVRVTNVGERPLEITGIVREGALDFVPLLEIDGNLRDTNLLTDPPITVLEANEFLTLQVRYTAQINGPAEATLHIRSNDPQQSEVDLPLAANVDAPCLTVSPGSVEFRTSLVDRVDSRTLLLESCGKVPVTIRRMSIREGSDPAFDLNPERIPEELNSNTGLTLPAYTDQDRLEGRPPPSREIEVTFAPREQRIHNGTLLIETTDPQFPEVEVGLLGRGVINSCPQARAVQETFDVVPLDTIFLDGSPSIDQDGPGNRPVKYEWVITNRPDGSTAMPVEAFFDPGQPSAGGRPDDPTTPEALFYVDLAGTYTAELRVEDNLFLNSSSCGNNTVVTIVAKPDEAIHVQLTWLTPGDEDLTDDKGADLDLHLLHPYAEGWGQRGSEDPFDCFFLNGTPDWGQVGNQRDDPILDIDDFNGAGPENINLNEPEDTTTLGAPYLIGVHYYRSFAYQSEDQTSRYEFGSSYARLRVYIRGELAWEYENPFATEDMDPGVKELSATDHFWDAAEIAWPSGRVRTRDLYWLSPPN